MPIAAFGMLYRRHEFVIRQMPHETALTEAGEERCATARATTTGLNHRGEVLLKIKTMMGSPL